MLRIDALDPALGALSHRADALALARAADALPALPMAGASWLVKDSLD